MWIKTITEKLDGTFYVECDVWVNTDQLVTVVCEPDGHELTGTDTNGRLHVLARGTAEDVERDRRNITET